MGAYIGVSEGARRVVSVPLSEAVGTMRTLDPDFLNEAEEFFR